MIARTSRIANIREGTPQRRCREFLFALIDRPFKIDLMKPALTPDQTEALRNGNGIVELEGDEPCVLISMPVYREMLGVGSDEEYQQSLRAIEQGFADIGAGRTRPLAEFFSEFDKRHGITD